MSMADLDDLFNDSGLGESDFMWSGGNLNSEDPNHKTYEEWLKYYGIEDDDEEDY